MAAFMGIKPQVVYLFWPALLFWSIHQRRWQVIAGGVAAGVAASIPPLLLNPQVFAQYWHSVTHFPPAGFISLTLGTLLRMAAGEPFANLRFEGRYFALQYVPSAIGLVLLAIYWWRRRERWDWAEEMPLLLTVGLFTAIYGAWPSDLVLLVVPVIQAAVWVMPEEQSAARWTALLCFLAINGLALAMSLLDLTALWFIWMGPAVLVAWLFIRRLRLGLREIN
jgi:hypothetical protein